MLSYLKRHWLSLAIWITVVAGFVLWRTDRNAFWDYREMVRDVKGIVKDVRAFIKELAH